MVMGEDSAAENKFSTDKWTLTLSQQYVHLHSEICNDSLFHMNTTYRHFDTENLINRRIAFVLWRTADRATRDGS